MKRVLMMAAVFPPDNASGAHRPFHFAKHLPEFGWQPCVLTMMPQDSAQLDRTRLDQLPKACRTLRVHPAGPGRKGFQALLGIPQALPPVVTETHSITRSHKRPAEFSGPKMLLSFRKRLRADLRFNKLPTILAMVAAGLREYMTNGFDVLWATGDPWSTLMAAYWVSRLTGCRLVVDMRDPWTYGFLARGMTAKEMAWSKAWEQRVLRKAARIVFTSPLTTTIMQSRIGGGAARRMLTITNGYAEQNVEPMRLAPADKCVFCYAGKFAETIRNPGVLFAGFQQACEDPDLARDVRLHLVGDMRGFEGDIPKYGLTEQVLCTGQVSSQKSLSLIHGADVLILLQTIPGSGRDAISGKAYEYLAAGKPILSIVPDDGGDAWLIRETHSGSITGITSPRRVAEDIRRYWEQWKTGKASAVRDSTILQGFSRRRLAADLARVFEELLGTVPGRDAPCGAPPGQIPASRITAPGSYLGS